MLLLPLYVTHLGASRTEVGALMATASIGGLLLRPLAGWALDTIGRRPTLIAGTIVLSGGMALISLPDTIGPLLYAARFLIGVGVGTLFTAYFTFAADIIPIERRTEGIALFGVSGLVPLAVNPLIDQLGVSPPQLRWVFPLVAIAVAGSLAAILALDEPERPQMVDHEQGPVFRALTAHPLRPVWLATVVFSSMVAIYMAFVTVTAESRGVPRPATLWFGYAAAAAGVRLIGGSLPAKLGSTNMVAPALAFYAAGLLIAAGADTMSGFMLSGVFAGIGHGYCFPVLTAQVVTRAPDALRGSALAGFTAIWEASALVLAPTFGWIADTTDDATMLTFSVLVSILGLATWAFTEHRLERLISADQ